MTSPHSTTTPAETAPSTADPDQTLISSEDKRLFLESIREGNIDAVRRSLEVGPDNRQKADVDLLLSSRDEWEQTLLMIASREGHNGIVLHLLDDFDVFVDEVRIPPKAQNPSWDRLMRNLMFRWALKASTPSNVNLSSIKRNGITALNLASQHGHPTVIETLLAHGADVNLHSTGTTALINASAAGKEECAHLLLAKGADLSLASTSPGFTPLIYSSWLGHTSIVAMLLEHGANPNKEIGTMLENTSLHMALSLRREDTVLLLLKHRADPNAVNKQGLSPFSMAICKDNVPLPNDERKPAVPFHVTLLEHGAKLTSSDFRSVIMFAGIGEAVRLRGYAADTKDDIGSVLKKGGSLDESEMTSQSKIGKALECMRGWMGIR